MPLIPPILPQVPDLPSATPRHAGVPAVDTVGDREPRREGSGQRRRKRRALLDLLMEEVEALPDLPADQKAAVRRNLRDFVRTETIRPRAVAPPGPPAAEPPPPAASGGITGAGDRGEPAADTAAPILRAALRYPSAEEQARIEENARLEDELRRCLAQHTEAARKIATYIHALQTLEHAPHLITIET